MGIFGRIDTFITWFDGVVWGLPLIILILVTGIFLTVRLGLLQVRYLGKALKFMVKNEEDGHGEVTSFGALCTALSATIGTGNIVGVATAISAGGPGALFWMILTAFLGMATKYSEGLLAVKYRTIDEDGHVLGGPFYYIENGMGVKFRWLAKIFAFFGAGVGLFGIGTFTQVNGISSAVRNFFDPNMAYTVALLQVSMSTGGNHPTVLIFDEPVQHSIVPNDMKQFLDSIVQLGKECQTIIGITVKDSDTQKNIDKLDADVCHLI